MAKGRSKSSVPKKSDESVRALNAELERVLSEGKFSFAVRQKILRHLQALRFESQSTVHIYTAAFGDISFVKEAVSAEVASILNSSPQKKAANNLIASIAVFTGRQRETRIHGKDERPPAETAETLRQKIEFVKSLMAE